MASPLETDRLEAFADAVFAIAALFYVVANSLSTHE